MGGLQKPPNLKKTMMKKITLLFASILFTTAAFSQFTVEDYDGEPILDGDIRTYTTLEESEATLYFWINNDSAEDILVKIKNESITNSDGSSYQFCFGTLCIFDVEEGQTYPVSGVPETIPAGGTNPQFDKFFNENPGDGTNYPIDYVWKFFQVDENGDEIGESITFTYRFDPTLSTNEFEGNNLGVKIHNTLANQTLIIESLKSEIDFTIFNLNGQSLLSNKVTAGMNEINVSSLTTGVYFIKFNNVENSTTLKFVVK